MIYNPLHLRANHNGYVREHILIAERALGYALPQRAQIHHANEQRSDNRHENLVICENDAYHKLLHQRLRSYCATGTVDAVKCRYCNKWVSRDEPGMTFVHRALAESYHRACAAQYQLSRNLE